MKRKSAGILLFRNDPLNFFLVHPGGSFWKNKDLGAWSIPKGEYDDDEEPLIAAIRELREETGISIAADAGFKPLEPVRLKSGKEVSAWAIAHDADAENITSNTFEIEWPPKSGRFIEIPEIDKAGWFEYEVAKEKINVAQVAFLDEVKGWGGR